MEWWFRYIFKQISFSKPLYARYVLDLARWMFFFSFRFHNFISMNFVMEKNLRIVEESRTWILFVEKPHRWGVISSHQYNLVIRYFLRNDICFLHANQYCFFFAKSELDFFVARVCIGSIENVLEWQTPFFACV